LDGNSLGALPRHTSAHVERIVRQEWGRHLIGGWNLSWWQAPRRLGGLLAPLLGAQTDEVIVSDTISLNLFKLITYALRLHPERRVILSEGGNFPTDQYIAQGLATLLPGLMHRTIPAEAEDPAAWFGDDVAVAVLSHVNYRSGRLYDMEDLTRRARARGLHLIWDLAHSAGALPLELNRCGVEFAVGCTYKYLNGGPGAPAFLYVRRDLQGRTVQPLTGWFGHADPFTFEADYRPAADIRQFLTGTHSALAYGALEASLELWQEVDLAALRAKSLSLTGLFMELMRPLAAAHGLRLLTPAEPARRGSQVAYYRDTDGYAIIQALIARGVIGDFRAPGLLRFGFAPLYLSHADVWQAVRHLREVLERGEYRDARFQRAEAVT
ncbi:MAG TPA: kynureninase, partial [Candidatus Competibacteraceae bacterium]|nr:kynureninase [Candidatus Competibacteraceae bacterium]